MLITRILTGAVLGLLVAGLALYGSTALFAAAIGLLWLAGAAEWSRLAGLGRLGGSVFTGGVLLLMVWFGWRGFGSPAAVAGVYGAIVAIVLAVVAMRRFPAVFPLPVIVVAGLVTLLPSWLAMAGLHMIQPGLALAGIVIVWGADVGAYAGGRTFGRRKLAPRISPGKTWAGVVGGLVTAMAVAALAAAWLGLSPWFIALGAAAALVSVVGDLHVSLLKRHAGLKDSGRLLPGHGGALDRIDGLTTGLPIIAIGLQIPGVLD